MSVIIEAANGAGTTAPLSVLSPYLAARVSRNVVHDLVGGGIAVSIVAPRLRSGELVLLYPDEATAHACLELHAVETTFNLSDTETPAADMRYAVAGDIRVALDEATLTAWTVTVGYQEVDA